MNSGILIPEFMFLTTIYTNSLSGKKVLGVIFKVFLQFHKTNFFYCQKFFPQFKIRSNKQHYPENQTYIFLGDFSLSIKFGSLHTPLPISANILLRFFERHNSDKFPWISNTNNQPYSVSLLPPFHIILK